jgi:hypothetical protein
MQVKRRALISYRIIPCGSNSSPEERAQCKYKFHKTISRLSLDTDLQGLFTFYRGQNQFPLTAW